MKDKVLIYAIGISVLVHLVVIGIIGITSGTRFATAAALPTGHTISVDLVANPDDAFKPQPKPAFEDTPQSQPETQPNTNPAYTPVTNNTMVPDPNQSGARPTNVVPGARANGTSSQMAGNPGGKLNIGSTSAGGDLAGNWSGGQTPSGYVPGSDNGQGIGSGSSAGVGTPEPPANAVEGPGTRPNPVPVAPKTVNERVCDDSGLIPGPYCKGTHTSSFIEGSQPTRVCNQCKAPAPEPVHRSTLADRANPEILRDTRVSVPASVDEGLSVTVEVEYTVTADGDVTGVRVTRSSGNRVLDKAVINAASGIKFKPAIQGGIPRSVKMTRPYEIKT